MLGCTMIKNFMAIVGVLVAGSAEAQTQTRDVTAADVFVADPASPRLLRMRRPGVIDNDYIAAMSLPAVPRSAMRTDVNVPLRPPGDVPMPSPLAASGPSGDIYVLEGFNGLVGTTEQGSIGFNHGQEGFGTVINEVLSNYGDEYDFVTVFTTFDDDQVAAYYLPLKQTTDGLGDCNPNNGETFGCLYDALEGSGIDRLQGFVFMNSLNTWRSQDYFYTGEQKDDDDQEATVFATLAQEVGHRWGAALRFSLNGRPSKLLLGRDLSHWAAYVDTDASVMDGWDWEEDGDEFRLVDAMRRFSTLDLYAMGALPVAQAKPLYIIDDARFIAPGTQFNNAGIPADAVLQVPYPDYLASQGLEIGARGTRIDVNIADIVDAEGNRCPDPDFTQRAFRQAIVVVTRPGQTASQATGFVDDLAVVMETWEQYWLEKTNKRFRICTQLEGDCTIGRMSLGGGLLDDIGTENVWEPGTTATMHIKVSAADADIHGVTLELEVLGGDASAVTLPDTIDVGTVAEGDEVDVPVEITISEDFPCLATLPIAVRAVATDAADEREEIRLFPGTRELFVETFNDEDDNFAVNDNDFDDVTSGSDGALRWSNVELTCEMTKRSPERDATADGRGAYVTGPGTDHEPNLLDNDAGEGAELGGRTSLSSPPIDLKGTSSPYLRFAYWLDGENGDSLTVQLSGDNEATFVDARTFEESNHAWQHSFVDVKATFEGKIPDEVIARFVFRGEGSLEGGIDDVRMVEPAGSCRVAGPCGCSTTHSSSSPWVLLGCAVASALMWRRGRRNP
jgi:hypothetical protein